MTVPAQALEPKKIPTEIGQELNTGGEEEDRTPDLCIANAALSQLSYSPTSQYFIKTAPEWLAFPFKKRIPPPRYNGRLPVLISKALDSP